MMQDFLSANGKKDLYNTEALNVMDSLLYYLQNIYLSHIVTIQRV